MNNILFIKRISIMFIGVVFIGLGIALLRGSGFGTDPFTAMNLGISQTLGISLGVFQLGFNMVLFFMVLGFGKQYIGLGMITNMTIVGFISDFFAQIISSGYTLEIKIIFTIIGVIIICFGVAMYSCVNLGLAPYDAIGWIVDDITNNRINFKKTRIFTDIACILIAITFDSIISINTIIMAFCTGPLVQFFEGIVKQKLVL